jgi:lipopolysaccharide exporter
MTTSERAASGAAWTLGLGLFVRALGLIGGVFLTYFIAPAEYGEVAGAVVVALSVVALTNVGFPRFVIARWATPSQAFEATLTQVALTSVGMLVAWGCAGPIGSAFGLQSLSWFFPGLALAFLIKVLSAVPEALLARSLEFKPIAMANALGEVAFVGTAVGAAPALGGMAIVAGNVARSALTALVLMSRVAVREWLVPGIPRPSSVAAMTRFAFPLAVGGWLSVLASRWDNLLVARLLGPLVLGHYALAFNLAQAPIQQLGGGIGDVLFPAFARTSNEGRVRGLAAAMSGLSVILFPVIFGLGAVAPVLAEAFLAPAWHPVGWMTSVLVLMSLGAPVALPAFAVLTVTGKSSTLVSLGILKLGLVLVCLASFGWLGPGWACGAVVLGYSLHSVAVILAFAQSSHMSAAYLVRPTLRPLGAAVIMGAAVLGLRQAIGGQLGYLPKLAVLCCAGVVVYAAGARFVARSQSAELFKVVRGLVRRSVRAAGAGPAKRP